MSVPTLSLGCLNEALLGTVSLRRRMTGTLTKTPVHVLPHRPFLGTCSEYLGPSGTLFSRQDLQCTNTDLWVTAVVERDQTQLVAHEGAGPTLPEVAAQ